MAKKKDIEKVESAPLQSLENIENLIQVIRGKQVILDRDLARLYGVETKRLNQQVQRNIERFPADFMFQLSKEEFEIWKSQFAISNKDAFSRSQIVISNGRGGQRYLPYAFTENGIAMLSSVLRSPIAIATITSRLCARSRRCGVSLRLTRRCSNGWRSLNIRN